MRCHTWLRLQNCQQSSANQNPAIAVRTGHSPVIFVASGLSVRISQSPGQNLLDDGALGIRIILSVFPILFYQC